MSLAPGKFAIFILFACSLITDCYAQSFTDSIKVSDGPHSQTLVFGLASGATDAYDVNFDVLAPPPPPAGAFDARFHTITDDFFKDIRGTTQDTTVWNIRFQPSTGNHITLSWTPDRLGGNGSDTLSDTYGGTIVSVDMSKVASYEVTNTSITQLNITFVRASKTAIGDLHNGNPHKIKLSQNYPNPFNPTTNIQYTLPKGEHVTLKVYNTLGQLVSTLMNKTQAAGSYTLNFKANNLPSGMYIYRLKAGNYTETKKMMLIK
ncbi:MAG TPA: T9SS type A sorting domain-containing protein [Balneolales bacterium]|nr:T9SS type A sorting domain-containing protein [Balneolales bacterium]